MSTWVLLRGLSRESRHWGAFPEVLREQLGRMGNDSKVPEPHILTPDLPGNGCLNGQSSPLHIEEVADTLRAQLLAQGAAPPYNLLAMSLGAMVTVAWAQRHPAEIAGAVLINTSLRPFSQFHQRLRPQNYIRLLRLLVQGGSDRAWEETIFELTSQRPDLYAATVAQWVPLRHERPVSRRNVLRQLWAAARYRAPRERPSISLLILGSDRDALVDCACSRQLAEQWCTAYAEHPLAGHDLPLDDAQWVARTIVDWQTKRAEMQLTRCSEFQRDGSARMQVIQP